MTIPDLKAWLAQPSTIKGFASVGGILAAAATHLLTHDLTTAATAGGMVYGLVHIAMPDNTGAPSSVEKLVTDAATAVAQKRLAAAMPQLLADTMAVVQSFQPPAGSTTVTTTTVAAPVATPVAAPVAA